MKVSAHLSLIALLVACGLIGAPARGQREAPAEPPPATRPAPPDEPQSQPPVDVPTEEAGAENGTDDEPRGDEEPADGAAEEESGEATLKIECDLDCTVTVGFDEPREVAAGEVLTVRTEPGAVRINAHVTDVVTATAFEDVTVAAGERQRVRLKMVRALEELRKVEARDRTFRDPNSRLMWQRRDNGTDLEWQEAVDFCAASEHGGWEDWRLPTVEELESIEAMWSLRAYKTADPIGLTACCPWSSERIDEENAWNFNFQFRRPFRGHLSYSYNLRALCVRDGSDEIPENTRRNRRLARREAKERQRERLRRQEEKAAQEAAQESAETAPEPPGDDSGGGLGRL